MIRTQSQMKIALRRETLRSLNDRDLRGVAAGTGFVLVQSVGQAYGCGVIFDANIADPGGNPSLGAGSCPLDSIILSGGGYEVLP